MVYKARKSTQGKPKLRPRVRGRGTSVQKFFIDLSSPPPPNEREGADKQLENIFRANSPTPTPTEIIENKLTPNNRKALDILHQLCAFEFLFMEFFALLDGLENKTPVRSSMKLRYEREGLFINPVTDSAAKRSDDTDDLEAMLKKITESQIAYKGNKVPIPWLQRIERNFISALHNPNLKLGISREIKDQVGLFVKEPLEDDSMLGKLQSKNEEGPVENPSRLEYLRQKHRNGQKNLDIPIDTKGIRFELFSLPRDITDVEKHGFNDDLTFDYTHRGKGYILMGLGMARVINHHCERISVEWPFKPNGLKFDTETRSIGCMNGKVVKKAAIMPGREVYGYYGDEFARLDCICSHHKSQTDRNASPGPSKLHNPQSPIMVDIISRANSMDLSAVQMEGSSPTPIRQNQSRSNFSRMQTPLWPDWDREKNLSDKRKEQANRSQRKKHKKRKSTQAEENEYQEKDDNGDEEEEEDDDDDDIVEYLETIPSDEIQHRQSPMKKNKRVVYSDEEVDELEEEEDDVFGTGADQPIFRKQDFDELEEDSDNHEILNENDSDISISSRMEILDKLDRLDKKLNRHTKKLKSHEDVLDDIVSNLIGFKEKIKKDRIEIEHCRKEERRLIDDLKKREKGKGKQKEQKVIETQEEMSNDLEGGGMWI